MAQIEWIRYWFSDDWLCFLWCHSFICIKEYCCISTQILECWLLMYVTLAKHIPKQSHSWLPDIVKHAGCIYTCIQGRTGEMNTGCPYAGTLTRGSYVSAYTVERPPHVPSMNVMRGILYDPFCQTHPRYLLLKLQLTRIENGWLETLLFIQRWFAV